MTYINKIFSSTVLLVICAPSFATNPDMARIFGPCGAAASILYGRTTNAGANKILKEIAIAAEKNGIKYAGKEAYYEKYSEMLVVYGDIVNTAKGNKMTWDTIHHCKNILDIK